MPKNLDRDLLDLERRYWQALKDNDVDIVRELTDDTCIVTGAQGVAALTRDSLAQMMGEATYELRSFEIGDGVTVQRLGDDVAILAYKVHEELEVDGEIIALDAADASTWVRRDGRWRCALHTESILGDSFGRDRVHEAGT